MAIETIEARPLSISSELSGRIAAPRIAEVRARVPGVVLQRVFREGSDVEKGDVLFRIDPAPFKADLDSAEAALRKAEANAFQARLQEQRYARLIEGNAISGQDYDNARAAARQTAADVAAVERARLNLGYATVTAPIAGRIGRALVTEGALVGQNETTPLALIQQLNPIHADLSQSTRELNALRRALRSGQLQQVGQDQAKATLIHLLSIHVRNDAGKMVPLSAFVQAKWTQGPTQLTRYNGYPAISISGEPAPGYSSGEAMAEIERLVAQGPMGLGQEWTGLSLQERLSGSQAPILLGLSLLVVFLYLAALYESWSIPTSVLLVVPLGVLGAVLAVSLRGMPNDVFFKVGLVTIIGLSAKNAILIIEFAKSLYDEGHDLIDATLQAARLRLRPIIMTSLAFILGVVPLAIATGASSASQRPLEPG